MLMVEEGGRAMALATEGPTLEELALGECLELLASSSVGRVAVGIPGEAPLVVPVNYVVDGDVVVFRSDPGTKVNALREGPVSFELDQVDPTHRSGWSVLVQGVAYEATEAEIREVDLESWVPG